jgi:hypothetical protein
MRRHTIEGKVYNCSWKKNGRRYLVWVESDVDLKVEAEDFDEAEGELGGLICEKTGDGEAVMEFNPPPPAGNRTNWTPIEIVSLGYNASADLVDREQPLFSKGRCTVCRTPHGERTKIQIRLKNIPQSDTFSVRNFLPRIRVFSESFVDLLNEQERLTLEFRPIEIEGKTRKKFFELIGRPQIAYSGIKGSTYDPLVCRQCPLCGTYAFFMRGSDIPMDIQHFVASEDLPSPLPSVLLLGHGDGTASLCMPRSRWLEIRGKPGTKGVCTSKIGIVPEERVERKPLLPIPEEWQTNFNRISK